MTITLRSRGFSNRIIYVLVFHFRKGGIFSKDSEDVVNAFLNAVQIVNRDNELLKLNANVITVDINDNFAVQLAG